MFVLGYLLQAIALVIDYVLYIYMWIVIARAVISWVNPDPYNPIVRFLYNVTDPILYQIRSRLPINYSGIDFSPIIVFLIIIFLQAFLVRSLHQAASYFL